MSVNPVYQVNSNRNYKDTLFRDLFGSESRKANALSLYNALAGSSHTNPDDLTITTIDGILYLGYRNDVSFILDKMMVLWEHQSTHNPNMALRGLFYFAQLYRRFLDTEHLNEYSSRLLEIPTPRYFVFYNGYSYRPEREIIKLSNSFQHGEGDLEVSVTVLNINEGQNNGIMEACDTLRGYAHLVALYRNFSRNMPAREAMDKAVSTCMEDGLLVDYLAERQSEVIEMLLREWDEDEYRELLKREATEDGYAEGHAEGLKDGRMQGLKEGREEGRAQGRAEGKAEGRAEGKAEGRAEERAEYLKKAISAVNSGALKIDQAAELFGFTREELAQEI